MEPSRGTPAPITRPDSPGEPPPQEVPAGPDPGIVPDYPPPDEEPQPAVIPDSPHEPLPAADPPPVEPEPTPSLSNRQEKIRFRRKRGERRRGHRLSRYANRFLADVAPLDNLREVIDPTTVVLSEPRAASGQLEEAVRGQVNSDYVADSR